MTPEMSKAAGVAGFLEEAALIADVDLFDEESGRGHFDDSPLCQGFGIPPGIFGGYGRRTSASLAHVA